MDRHGVALSKRVVWHFSKDRPVVDGSMKMVQVHVPSLKLTETVLEIIQDGLCSYKSSLCSVTCRGLVRPHTYLTVPTIEVDLKYPTTFVLVPSHYEPIFPNIPYLYRNYSPVTQLRKWCPNFCRVYGCHLRYNIHATFLLPSLYIPQTSQTVQTFYNTQHREYKNSVRSNTRVWYGGITFVSFTILKNSRYILQKPLSNNLDMLPPPQKLQWSLQLITSNKTQEQLLDSTAFL